jgi:hypothetical protein
MKHFGPSDKAKTKFPDPKRLGPGFSYYESPQQANRDIPQTCI